MEDKQVRDESLAVEENFDDQKLDDQKLEDQKLGDQLDSLIEEAVLETESQKPKQKMRLENFKRGAYHEQGWLFVLPAVLLMCVFTFYPIINTFVSAFKVGYKPLDSAYELKWGFENFVRVLRGDTGTGGANFARCFWNTLAFTFISVPVSTLLALLISVALNSIKVLQKAYQTIFFLPYLTNALAMGAVFATLFNVVGTGNRVETVGLINVLLGRTVDNYINWINLGSDIWANRFVVIVYEIWSGLPFKILILFSALQNVNKQYYDAAKVDGASKSTILWKITVPLISPMLSYLLITGIMGGMKVYTAVVGLFGESMGQEYEVGTMVGYLYNYIEKGETGYAAAGSLILFGIIMIITLINLYVSKKRVHY